MVSVSVFSQVSLLSVTYKTLRHTITLGKTLTLLFVNSTYKNLNYTTGEVILCGVVPAKGTGITE